MHLYKLRDRTAFVLLIGDTMSLLLQEIKSPYALQMKTILIIAKINLDLAKTFLNLNIKDILNSCLILETLQRFKEKQVKIPE